LAPAGVLRPWREPQEAGSAFGSTAGSTALIARLFVILAASHLFLDTSVLNQLSEAFHGVRNRFMLSQTQFDHKTLLLREVSR